MTKIKTYHYIGYNGTIFSTVLLPDINHKVYYRLTADKNKLLTDGTKQVHTVTVPEEDVSLWTEIVEGQE